MPPKQTKTFDEPEGGGRDNEGGDDWERESPVVRNERRQTKVEDEWDSATPSASAGVATAAADWDRPSSSAPKRHEKSDEWDQALPNLVDNWFPPAPKVNVSPQYARAPLPETVLI